MSTNADAISAPTSCRSRIMSLPIDELILSRLLIATGAGIAAFWVLFFTAGLAPANPPACYFVFEHAFPLPDLVLAAALVAAGRGLAHGKPWSSALSLACAGGLVFLGLVDLSFNAQNGLYSQSLSGGLSAAAINLWCVGLGAAIVLTLGSADGVGRLARSGSNAAQ
jgi:hypothetical protein